MNNFLSNFTVVDVLGSVEATLLLTLFLFVPGYVISWATNAFSFRQRRAVTQVALSTPLGVAVVPIVVFLLGRYPRLLWAVFIAVWVVFACIVGRNRKSIFKGMSSLVSGKVWIAICFALIWGLVAIGSLVDLQSKNRLYTSVTSYDYSLRAAITAEAARAIPPANPFFASTPPVPLKYHYFWMLVCSLPVRLAHLPPQDAMYGGTVWAGVILMSLIAICFRFFFRARENIERKILIGCGLLLVTGLDILPTIYLYFQFHWVTADMEWWNDQITSWVDALLWAPHHVMGLVACVLGFLLLREPGQSKGRRMAAILLAGFAFASAVGLSVLVTFTFVVFVALLIPTAVLRRWYDDLVGFGVAGAIAFLLAVPYLKILTGAGAGVAQASAGGAPFAVFSVRDFSLGVGMVAEILKRSPYDLMFLRWPLLPLNYFIELGFFFIVGLLRVRALWRRRIPMTRVEGTAWLMVLASFLVGTFLRSTTIGSNDLGWRSFLVAQFILLLWGAVMVEEWWAGPRPSYSRFSLRLAQACMFLGVLATLYQATMLRIYPILHDDPRLDPRTFDWVYADQKFGERTYALRSVYRQLNRILPADSVIQYNPETPSRISHGVYSNRQAAVGGVDCVTPFGGDSNTCAVRLKVVLPLYLSPLSSQDARVDDVCRQYGISVLLVENTDLVWNRPDSWVWTRTPVAANEYVRAIACGDSVQQARFKPAP